MLPERAAAADQVLPHPRLRFVNAERHGLAGRQAVAVGPQALLVDAVARFVQRAEERAGKEVLVVARREPHVARAVRRAERMGRDVEPPAVKSKPIAADACLPNCFLHGDGDVALEHVEIRPAPLLGDRGDQRHQLLAQPGEHAGDFGRLRTRLVFVEQRIVRLVVVADRGGLLALELDRALQQRPETREVVRLAGLDPHLLAEHGQLGELFDERLRQLRLAIVVAPQVDDVGAGVAVRIGRERTVGQLGQPLAHFGRRLALVNQRRPGSSSARRDSRRRRAAAWCVRPNRAAIARTRDSRLRGSGRRGGRTWLDVCRSSWCTTCRCGSIRGRSVACP